MNIVTYAKAVREYLNGKKTYILGVAGLGVIGLYMYGSIDFILANQLMGALGFGGLITLRAGVNK